LIAQGANDVRVKASESEQIVKAMQARSIPVTYVYYSDEGHGFRREENRRSFNAVLELFLAQHLGGRAEPVGDDFAGSSIELRAEQLAKERLEAKRKEAEKQEAAKRAAEGATADAAAMERPMQARPEMAVQATPPETPMLQNFFREARAHFEPAINAEIGFVERLLWFWSNHFCVNADATVMAGAYEREAIRPHVLGRFVDMLLAAEGHPAMLVYLDNAQSTGPNSVAGINNSRGLNENLAREILELHTIGVRTVYSQEDVTNFAKVITGWTILPTATNPEHGGE